MAICDGAMCGSFVNARRRIQGQCDMTIDSDSNDTACDTDSESASGDDFLLWAAIDDSETFRV